MKVKFDSWIQIRVRIRNAYSDPGPATQINADPKEFKFGISNSASLYGRTYIFLIPAS
jgi:hypothetical protein